MPTFRPTLKLDVTWLPAPDSPLAIEPELFALLDALQRTGKLTVAAQEVGLAYRQAWGLLTTWSARLGQPLVHKERGRGTGPTPFGLALAAACRSARETLAPHLAEATRHINDQLANALCGAVAPLRIHASHDLVLAKLRDELHAAPDGPLDIRFVGSLDSVIALARSQCDIAGFHVPEGPLGREAVRQFEPWLKPRAHRLVHFVRRRQGLIVARGNPLGIHGVGDLVRSGVRFINRQRGSGTRIAFEQLLAANGIAPTDIDGYANEEHTHVAVAAAIAAGLADAGLGIEAAADRLKTDFVPLFTETYYLLMRRDAIDHENVRRFLAHIGDTRFRDLASAFAGYDATQAGTVHGLAAPISGRG